MKKTSGVLVLALALVFAPACASVNGKQAVIEGGTGAAIGAVLGFAVGTTMGHPNDGARIGAAVGGTVGTTHGLFNRDEEIIAKEQQAQDALALSNQALAKALENQRTGAVAPRKISPSTSSVAPAVKPKSPTPAVSLKKPAAKKPAAPNAVMLCKCEEVEVYNAASFGIRAKAGQDPTGTFVPAQTPVCLPQGKVSVRSETIPPSDWIVKDPGMAKRVILQDADFKK